MDHALAELKAMAGKLPAGSLDKAAGMILGSEKKGQTLHVTGVGKPEHVARYAASSLSSTGTPCHFLHGTEALHGSIGQVRQGDIVMVVSDSGETREIKELVQALKRHGARILAVSGHPGSWLVRNSEHFLDSGVRHEGDRLGLAPRASTLAQVLVLAGLGVCLQERKHFKAADFRRRHPHGSLGR
jgi:arabinose-5-phosphate isomerase